MGKNSVFHFRSEVATHKTNEDKVCHFLILNIHQLSLGFSVSILISSLGLPWVLLNETCVSMSGIQMGTGKPAQVAFYSVKLGLGCHLTNTCDSSSIFLFSAGREKNENATNYLALLYFCNGSRVTESVGEHMASGLPFCLTGGSS